MLFQHRYCNRCIHDKSWREKEENPCPIFGAALLFHVDEPEYPEELQREGPVGGYCTKFEQDPDEPVYSPDLPRVPTPAEIVGVILGDG